MFELCETLAPADVVAAVLIGTAATELSMNVTIHSRVALRLMACEFESFG